MSRNSQGVRHTLETEAGIIREPFTEVVRKIKDAVCKYRNNFSVKTDGVLTTSDTEQISKITITIEIFVR